MNTLNYDKIIELARTLNENKDIAKDGLFVLYVLEADFHKKLDEDLFYRSNKNNPNAVFEHRDVIEVTIGEINFKFIKKSDEE